MSEVPANNKQRKPTPKKSFSLQDYKQKNKMSDVPDKPLTWIPLSPSMIDATGLPGFAMGYVNLARGFSNTGKSTAICEGIVSAQKISARNDIALPILPIIIDTENNIGRERLTKMGFDWGGDYIEIDNDYLLENFGKKQNPKRREAAIEDLAACIYHFIDEQEAGNLPFHLLFAIDSFGTLDCIRTIDAQAKDSSDNNMWNAGAFEKSFKYLLNNTIPSSRKETKEFTNTIIGVQKIWIDNMGAGVVKHKGGETFYYGSRLIYHFGGVAAHGTKKVTGTSKSREIAYGIETKVSVAKNQVDGPLGGVSFEGDIISTPHGFIRKDGVDNYKKEHIRFFRDALGDPNINAGEIVDRYVEIKQGESLEIG